MWSCHLDSTREVLGKKLLTQTCLLDDFRCCVQPPDPRHVEVFPLLMQSSQWRSQDGYVLNRLIIWGWPSPAILVLGNSHSSAFPRQPFHGSGPTPLPGVRGEQWKFPRTSVGGILIAVSPTHDKSWAHWYAYSSILYWQFNVYTYYIYICTYIYTCTQISRDMPRCLLLWWGMLEADEAGIEALCYSSLRQELLAASDQQGNLQARWDCDGLNYKFTTQDLAVRMSDMDHGQTWSMPMWIWSCIGADINPFLNLDSAALQKFVDTAQDWHIRAAILSDDYNILNRALADGDIDFYISGGVYTVAHARLAGHHNLQAITPASGSIDGLGGIVFAEITSVLQQAQSPMSAKAFLEYIVQPDIAYRIATSPKTLNPVAQMGNPKVFGKFSREQLDAIQWDTLADDIARCAMYQIAPDHAVLRAHLLEARRLRDKAE